MEQAFKDSMGWAVAAAQRGMNAQTPAEALDALTDAYEELSSAMAIVTAQINREVKAKTVEP